MPLEIFGGAEKTVYFDSTFDWDYKIQWEFTDTSVGHHLFEKFDSTLSIGNKAIKICVRDFAVNP